TALVEGQLATGAAGGEGPVPESGLTVAGSILGTPQYMPPEQAEGRPVDKRADVYALGAILYHVLARVPPSSGATSAEIIKKVLSLPPRPLEELQRSAPEDLITIVGKAMARNPSDRYATAGELGEDLKRFQTGQLVNARKYSQLALFTRWL